MQRSRLALLALAVVASLVFRGRLTAQNQLISIDEINQQFGKLKLQFIVKVLPGLEPATTAQLETASRYYVLRLTDSVAQTDPKLMGAYVKEFDGMIATATASNNVKANRDNMSKFAPHLISRFKEVFALDPSANRVTVVNAAALLPDLARLKQEEIGRFLASLVAQDMAVAKGKEKEAIDAKTLFESRIRDVIRTQAAKGLREFFPTAAFTKADLNQGAKTKQAIERKDFDVKCIDALLQFVDRPMPPVNTAEEVDAIRYMRKEAVTTLARTGVPAASAMGGTVEGNVALGLVKVLSKKVQPEPLVQERLEAAIGVCHFSKWVEEYDPKVGIFLVGECLADVFGEYKKDFGNIGVKGKDRKPTYYPWKHTSKRLQFALSDLVNNTRNTPSAAGVLKMESVAKSLLDDIANSAPLGREAEFRKLVQELRPTTKVLFKNQKGKMLEFDWEAAAAAEEK